jgi:hypothetical protein
MDERPVIEMQRKTQYLVLRVDDIVGTSAFVWDWNDLDYSPVSKGSPHVMVYGYLIPDSGYSGPSAGEGWVPRRENHPQIHWRRPRGMDF